MAQNIINTNTGQLGYQVPGASLQPGWQWVGQGNTQGGSVSSPVQPGTISSTSLVPATQLSAPVVQPSTQAGGLLAQVQARIDAANTPDPNLKSDVNTAKQSLYDTLFNSKGSTQLTSDAYQTDVNPAKQALLDFQAETRVKSLGYQREAQAVTGGTAEGRANAVSDISRKASHDLADRMVIEQGLQGRYSIAKEIADRAVSAQLEEQSNHINALKFWYDENKAELTKKEDRQYNSMITEKERLYNEQKTEKTAISNLVIDATKFNAPASILQQAQRATTAVEAAGILHGYLSDPLDRAYKQAQIDGLKASGAIATTLTASVGQDGYTNTDLYAKTRATSKMSPTEFDNRYGYLVNPNARARLGVSTASTANFGQLTAADQTKGINYLLNNGASQDDVNKFQTDRGFQAWVLNQALNQTQ